MGQTGFNLYSPTACPNRTADISPVKIVATVL
jgi:hypothetical protein